MTGVETGYVKEALSPLAVATVDASKGAAPSASTKIVVEAGVPIHCLTTWTVENSWEFVTVQVRTPRCWAGDTTGNGPPVYG